MSLWRLDDSIVPLHTDDDRDVLLHRDEDGCCEVVSPRQADEIAAQRLGGDVRRRTVLSGMAALGLLSAASAQPRYAFAAGATAGRDVLVVVFLRGAADGLQALVPFTESGYYAARPTIGLRREQIIGLDARFGFHPALRPLMGMWNAGELAAIPAAGNVEANRSHFDAQLDMERAAPASVRSGWLGRHLSAVSSERDLVRAVTMGSRAVASTTTTFPTAAFSGELESFGINAWDGYKSTVTSTIGGLYRRAGGGLATAAAETIDGIGALAAARATPVRAAAYPVSDFGKGLAEVSRLIRSGAPVEAACVDRHDWDMHAFHGAPTDQWGRMRVALDDLARSLAAFRADLGTHWQRTTVVVMTEFGRRLEENSNRGTDHGSGGLMLVAGGNVRGGLHGRWPGLAPSDLDDGDLAVANDYRDVIGEVLTKRLATPDLATVFPGFSHSPLGLIRS